MTADAARNPCQGCGTDLRDNPPSTHCGHCPPWTCPTCDGIDSMTDPCACWVVFDGLPLADIKGHLAAPSSLPGRTGSGVAFPGRSSLRTPAGRCQ